MPLRVIRNFTLEPSYKLWSLGSWTYKRHFTANDVDKLWQLIDSELSYDTTDASDTRVILFGPDRSIWLCIYSHRSKLHDGEFPIALTNPRLPIQQRSPGIEFDCNCRE